MSSKAIVVIGIGATGIAALRDATCSEEDWQAFDRSAVEPARTRAKALRKECDAWCVTVSADHVTEEELDHDEAVKVYVTERPATLTIEQAREIIATVARGSRGLGRIQMLVDEIEHLEAAGNVVLAEERIRTLDDLAGHFADGHFIGGRRIIEALTLCRKHPSKH